MPAPRTFPGDPNPPPVTPEPPRVSTSTTSAPTSSAGTGALPPTASTSAAPAPAAEELKYSVVERADGSYDGYQWNKDSPTLVRAGMGAGEDTREVLHAVGDYDPRRKVWENVPPGVFKALTQGRPSPTEYWSTQWGASEASAVAAHNALLFWDGRKPLETARAESHEATVKAQLAERPDMAWTGKQGIVAEFLKNPGAAVLHAGVKTVGEAVGFIRPVLSVLAEALAGAGLGAAAATPLAASVAASTAEIPPVAALAAVGTLAGGASAGATVGTFHALYRMELGNILAERIAKGLPEDAVRHRAAAGAAVKAALWMTSFKYLPVPGKQALIAGLAKSPAAIQALAKIATGAGATGGMMALQSEIGSLLNNMAVATTGEAGKALLESPADAAMKALEAGMVGLTAGAAGGVLAAAISRKAAAGSKTPSPERPADVSPPSPAESASGERAAPGPHGEAAPGGSSAPSSPKDRSLPGSSSHISVDPTIADVKTRADAWLDQEAAARGMVNDDKFKLQFGASVHREGNRIAAAMGAEVKALPTLEAKHAWLESDASKRYSEAGKIAMDKLTSLREAYPEIVKQLPHDFEGETKVLEGFKDPLPPTPPPEPVKTRDFVVNRPFDLNNETTTKDMRAQHEGMKHEQLVRGNQLAAWVKEQVPSELERQGMFWYKAAEGNEALLQEALGEAEHARGFDVTEEGTPLDAEQKALVDASGVRKSALGKYVEQIKAALNLSDTAKAALKKIEQYYAEAGAVSEEIGTIRSVLENYQNRMYAPERAQDYIRTETQQGLKPSTSHAKQRFYETEFDAAREGKTFATTDVADAMAIHNAEMAAVNTAHKLADALADASLGAWKREVPDGWKRVGNLEKSVPIKDKNGEPVLGEDGNQLVSHSVFVAPEKIADGLSAIADPDFVKKVPALRAALKAQGIVKTVNVSWSLFHHLSMLAQTIYQRDFATVLQLPWVEKALAEPSFGEREQYFALHNGMTSMVDSNIDVLRNIVEKNKEALDGAEGKSFKDLPGVKQILAQTDRNTNYLFGKWQRLMKVNSFSMLASDWAAKNPTATPAEVSAAMRGYADHVNAVFGGLNWGEMGMTKSNLSLLRLGFLAPDWTLSNGLLLKQAFGGGTEGGASRAHIVSALAMGILGVEAVNKLWTGHFTDKNAAGHKLEIEISPGVYVSFLRGGIGDIVKLYSMLSESGAKGGARFAQGKLAPGTRAVVGALTGTKYTGGDRVRAGAGPVVGTYDFLKHVLGDLSPIPFGMSNLLQYAQSGKKMDVGSAAVVTSGLGRFSKK